MDPWLLAYHNDIWHISVLHPIPLLQFTNDNMVSTMLIGSGNHEIYSAICQRYPVFKGNFDILRKVTEFEDIFDAWK